MAELIISVMIILLILIIIASVFSLNQKVFRKSNLKAELDQNARITLDLMAREIRQAKALVTALPADNSNPALVPHEIQFEDGHNTTQIQYIRYYLDGGNLNRQTIVYYFDTSPGVYVRYNDVDAFGAPESNILEDKVISENFSALDFYGTENITIDLTLTKRGEQVQIRSIINPRNI